MISIINTGAEQCVELLGFHCHDRQSVLHLPCLGSEFRRLGGARSRIRWESRRARKLSLLLYPAILFKIYKVHLCDGSVQHTMNNWAAGHITLALFHFWGIFLIFGWGAADPPPHKFKYKFQSFNSILC